MTSYIINKHPVHSSSTVIFSLVIPTYNESGNIKKLLESLINVLDPFLPHSYEIIVVDDNSPDGTSQEVERLINDHKQIRLLTRKDEKGLSSAVVRGWQAAQGRYLGVIDGDMQHPPQIMAKLLEGIIHDEKIDLVIASRFVGEGSTGNLAISRRIMSSWGRLIGLTLLPKIISRVSDPMSGCFVVRHETIAGCALDPMGYKILVEVIARANIKNIKEVSYVFQKRHAGRSKISFNIVFQYILQLLKLRSR